MAAAIFPPGLSARSYTTGSCPMILSCHATDSPAGPPPMIAIFLPVGSAGMGSAAFAPALPRADTSTGGRKPLVLVQLSMHRFGQR